MRQKEQNNKIKKLEEKLVGLRDNMHDNFEEIEKLQTELESEIENKTQSAVFRARMRYYDEGEKPSKYFLNLEKRRFNKKVVNKLRVENKMVTNPDEILREEVKIFIHHRI